MKKKSPWNAGSKNPKKSGTYLIELYDGHYTFGHYMDAVDEWLNHPISRDFNELIKKCRWMEIPE